MVKAILFDFGGVIYEHPKAVIPEVIARVYNVPLAAATDEWIHHKNDYYIGKIPTDKFITCLSDAFKSNKSVEEVKNLWFTNYSELAKANREVLEIIKNLRKKYKIYLLSNTTELSNLHNRTTGIYDYFDGLFMSFEMGVKKPYSDFYKKAISELIFEPEECIFIDDDEQNIESAKKLGIKTILFNILKDNPVKLKKELEKTLSE